MLQLEQGRYLTPTAARRDVAGARIIETTYLPGQRLPRHAHDFVYMVVMIGGALRETSMGRDHDLRRGWVVFNSAGEGHHNLVLAERTRCLNVELRPQFLSRLGSAGWRAREPVVYTHVGSAIDAVGRLHTAMLDPGADAEVEEALVDLVAAAWGARESCARGHFEWLARVLEYLHDRPDADVCLDTAAAIAGVHRTHLCRSFRSALGCTLGEYQRRLRADAAHRRVIDGTAPLASIARACGFADQSHLTRDFRRRFGRAPAHLRRAALR